MARCMSVVCSEKVKPVYSDDNDDAQEFLDGINANLKSFTENTIRLLSNETLSVTLSNTGLNNNEEKRIKDSDGADAIAFFVPYGEIVLNFENTEVRMHLCNTDDTKEERCGFTFYVKPNECGIKKIYKVVYMNGWGEQCTTNDDIEFAVSISNDIAHKFVDIISEYDTEGDDDDEPQQEPATKLDQDSNGVKRGRDEDDGERPPKKFKDD